MKTLIKIALICLIGMPSFAQQDPMISQYMFNGLYLNPAYAGSHKYFSSTLQYRKQWVDFDGAPQTIIGAVDGPLADNKMGVGLVLMNDQVGITRQTDVLANYSYHLQLGSGKLAFGLKAGVSQYRATFSDPDFVAWNKEEDPIYSSDLQSELIPRFGTGAYYYAERWYAGVSVPTLLAVQKDRDFALNINDASYLRRHLYITGGYVFDLTDTWKLKTSTLMKFISSAPMQFDLNINFLYRDMIWLGASYRTGDSFVGIVEYQANQRFRIGYSYDLTTTALKNYSFGTHEIMVGYDFGKDFTKMKTPRFF